MMKLGNEKQRLKLYDWAVEELQCNGIMPMPGRATLNDVERYHLAWALVWSDGSTMEAAKRLGVSRRKVQYMIRRFMGE